MSEPKRERDFWPGDFVRCTVDGSVGVYQGPEPGSGVFFRVLRAQKRTYTEELWAPDCVEKDA